MLGGGGLGEASDHSVAWAQVGDRAMVAWVEVPADQSACKAFGICLGEM